MSGLFVVLTSLSLSTLIRGRDRRAVLLGLTTLMLVSGLVVAAAPNYLVLMVGRALIGVVIGGFWSMCGSPKARLTFKFDMAPLSSPQVIAFCNDKTCNRVSRLHRLIKTATLENFVNLIGLQRKRRLSTP